MKTRHTAACWRRTSHDRHSAHLRRAAARRHHRDGRPGSHGQLEVRKPSGPVPEAGRPDRGRAPLAPVRRSDHCRTDQHAGVHLGPDRIRSGAVDLLEPVEATGPEAGPVQLLEELRAAPGQCGHADSLRRLGADPPGPVRKTLELPLHRRDGRPLQRRGPGVPGVRAAYLQQRAAALHRSLRAVCQTRPE